MSLARSLTATVLGLGLLLGAGQAARAEKALNLGVLSADMGILEPHLSSTTANLPIMDSIFNALVRFAPGSASLEKIEPDLAERWESSPDGKVWTFHLRKGVQFHHGYGELTAEGRGYSLQKAASKETSTWYSEYAAVDKIEALDPYTVRIALKHTVPSFLGLVVNYHGGMILSKKAVEKLGADFKLKPVGTGPFAFEEYVPKQKTVLKAQDQYFRGRPNLDKVVSTSSRWTRLARWPSSRASWTSSRASSRSGGSRR